MDFREEVQAAWRRAYRENPGLEQFRARKKALLWGVMALFILQKGIMVAAMWRNGHPLALLFGGVMGLAIPGIFVLAAWRGEWKLSLTLLLPAAYLAYDVIGNGLSALAGGASYYPVFYVILAVEGFMALYLAGVTLWLSVPEENRRLGTVMNRVNEYILRRCRELSARPR